MCNPSAYTALNSIIDSTIGDERSFFRVKEVGPSEAKYGWKQSLVAGHSYEAFIYYQNDVASNILNGATKNARVSINMPSYVDGTGNASASVSADNANPQTVTDTIVLTADDGPLGIKVDPGSAHLLTKGRGNGLRPSVDALQESGGTPIGCDALDGVLTGEDRCVGYLEFSFSTFAPSFKVDSYETTKGKERSVEVTPGAELSMTTSFTNTGQEDMDGIAFVATAGPGLSIRAETVTIQRITAGKPGPVYTARPTISSSDELSFKENVINAVPAGDSDLVSYRVMVDKSGPFQCGNVWLPITSTVTSRGIPVIAKTIANVASVC